MDMVRAVMDMVGELMDMVGEVMDMVKEGVKANQILPGILGIPGISGVLRQFCNFYDVLKLESDHW